MAAVKFSATPSCMILTLVARNRPSVYAERRATRSATCSTPRSRSHQSAPTTQPVSVPRAPRARRSGPGSAMPGVVADDRVLPARDARASGGSDCPASRATS